MKIINPELCHDTIRDNMIPCLSFDEKKDFNEWKKELREKFLSLTGIDKIQKNACPLNFEIEDVKQKEGYKQIRFTIESEKNCVIPCYICIPDNLKGKAPVSLDLQGHSKDGMKSTLGESWNEEKKCFREGECIQAVKRGYIAVAIEMRGMGELRPMRWNHQWADMCSVTALQAFEIGRTVAGERMWDVSRVIDALSNFPECDLDDICVSGGSGGGTASFYSACFDSRIKVSAPCCGFSPYKTSILDVYHCPCNYIPYALQYFDMPDLAALIAPRKLVITTGAQDRIFPVDGVKKCFETIKKIYEKAGAKDNCMLNILDKGHCWDGDVVFDSIEKMRNLYC